MWTCHVRQLAVVDGFGAVWSRCASETLLRCRLLDGLGGAWGVIWRMLIIKKYWQPLSKSSRKVTEMMMMMMMMTTTLMMRFQRLAVADTLVGLFSRAAGRLVPPRHGLLSARSSGAARRRHGDLRQRTHRTRRGLRLRKWYGRWQHWLS